MKYIIIGLGEMGSVLAEELSQLGNEVIGIDKDMEKVENIKSKISTALCLNIVDKSSLEILPQKGIDTIFISVHKDIGACLTIYSVVKDLKVGKIYIRASDSTQYAILKSLGIQNVFFPEKVVSRQFALLMELKGFISSYKIDDDHYIIEREIPEDLVGKSYDAADFEKNTKLKFICLKHSYQKINALGVNYYSYKISDSYSKLDFLKDDRIVIMGEYKDIINF
jgi:trk system potassium uptake protein